MPPVPVNVPFTIHEQDKGLIRQNLVEATVQVCPSEGSLKAAFFSVILIFHFKFCEPMV
jgi:hypothetical protein